MTIVAINGLISVNMSSQGDDLIGVAMVWLPKNCAVAHVM